jgi:hypothetical protein
MLLLAMLSLKTSNQFFLINMLGVTKELRDVYGLSIWYRLPIFLSFRVICWPLYSMYLRKLNHNLLLREKDAKRHNTQSIVNEASTLSGLKELLQPIL